MWRRRLWVLSLCVLGLAGCGEEKPESESENSGDKQVICGDGIVQTPEVCDDGNTNAGDGCSADCGTVESGFECLVPGSACTSIHDETPEPQPEPENVCGDSHLDPDETCDDGNTVDGDGCSADCSTIESGFICPTPGTACEPEILCGNGKLDADEVCDDGNTDAEDGCSEACDKIETGYRCDRVGQLCVLLSCGDGVIDDGELCDSGKLNMPYWPYDGGCSPECRPAHYCGDGLLDAIDRENGEECDAGKDTSDIYEGCNLQCKRVNFCGDGQKTHEETCDDANTAAGDGCSETCQMEPGFSCVIKDGKSICTEILCGNGKLDAGEQCDDGQREAGDGCSAICLQEKGWFCTSETSQKSVCTKTCGNGVLDSESGEWCDDGNLNDGDGCSKTCMVEQGYACPNAGQPCIAKACGDGIQAAYEQCDDGNMTDGDGCSSRCRIETGYLCSTPGKACESGYCGDGKVQVGEQCDDGNAETAGCSETCMIEPGFACKAEGGECMAMVCGDGSIQVSAGYTGFEQCDDGNTDAGDGCSELCLIETGYHCDSHGLNCVTGTCGDGHLDIGEPCDDGNTLPNDGCSPLCHKEAIFECDHGTCKPVCGDGVTMWMLEGSLAEECDDGNLTAGDGCSPDCRIETGFTCTDFKVAEPPAFIQLPVTYRDFRSYFESGTGDGYITSETDQKYSTEAFQAGYGHPDFHNYGGCHKTGYAKEYLDAEGKPELTQNGFASCFAGQNAFKMWYRDTPNINRPVHHQLYLWLKDKTTKEYYFTSDNHTTNGAPNVDASGNKLENGYFNPINQVGYGVTPGYTRNYSFTSEVRTYFQYQGGEKLTFSGDDDLWVYLNGRLFVDLGGLHTPLTGTNTLAADTYTGTDSNGNTITMKYDPKYEVYEGGIYEISLFHAERRATGSNFSLTLKGFLNTGKAICAAQCGDGIIRGDEECDYAGAAQNDPEQNKQHGCVLCKLQSFCGNGKIEAGEQCDTQEAWCDPVTCRLVPDTCGNGVLDEHEACDYMAPPVAGVVCLDTCQKSGCGDGVLDENNGEECDDGNTSNDDMCTTLCKRPFCGDGITTPSLGEVCDDGINDGAYGHCGLGCAYQAPNCGDGIVDTAYEQCDDGTNNGAYGTCNPDCTLGIRCGDGVVQPEFEQCDNGEQQSSSCSSHCMFPVN